jgi:uncharacterized damage-inducible protein DinB
MKETLLMYARYTEKANAAVLALLAGLPAEALTADRKSYYKSLAGLARHLVGGTIYFQGLVNATVASPVLADAARAYAADAAAAEVEDGDFTPATLARLAAAAAAADRATVDFVAGLSDGAQASPVKLDWYGGKPATVPLWFLLNQLWVHGLHHRGQISQLLDELGVANDFSGIGVEFLP